MVYSIRSLGLHGVTGYPVSVECDLSGGLPAFNVVGLPDAAVNEARERVRSAIKNCGFTFPVSRITVNLAPAHLKKVGTLYDLPILVGILCAGGQLKLSGPSCAFVGELSLSGRLRPCAGMLPMALRARADGIEALYVPEENAAEEGLKHMKELNADLVVSTHWATNYYAMHLKDRPLTAMYCPDAKINTLFRYPCDLMLASMPTGYNRARKLHFIRYNEKNIKLVPFLIRKEAFSVSRDKRENRRLLVLDEDKFTVVLAEGGYGVGKIKQMTEELLSRDLPINLVPVCGRNRELYEYFLTLTSKGNTTFRPFGLVDNMFQIIAAADITCGKSGASMMAEPCFFGVPQMITHYATDIERWIGKYYLKTVGSAIKIFNVKKAADKIEEFVNNPALLEPYKRAAESQRENYGAEKCARYIFGLLCTRFPELKDGTELY